MLHQSETQGVFRPFGVGSLTETLTTIRKDRDMSDDAQCPEMTADEREAYEALLVALDS